MTDEAKVDAIRAAFRASADAGIRLDRATPEGETWTAVRYAAQTRVVAEFRRSEGDEIPQQIAAEAARGLAEADGAIVLDQPPEFTWIPMVKDDDGELRYDHYGLARNPDAWTLFARIRVAVPEGHPALLADEEAV